MCLSSVARSPASGGGLKPETPSQAAWHQDPQAPLPVPFLPLAPCAHPKRARHTRLDGLQRKTPVPHSRTHASPCHLTRGPALRRPGSRALWRQASCCGMGSRDTGASVSPTLSFQAKLCWLTGSPRAQLPSTGDKSPSVPLAEASHGQLETPQAAGTGLSGHLCLCTPASQRGVSPCPQGKHTSCQATWDLELARQAHSRRAVFPPGPAGLLPLCHRPRRCPWSSGPRRGSHLPRYCVQNRKPSSRLPPNLLTSSLTFPAHGTCGCRSLGLHGGANPAEGYVRVSGRPWGALPPRAGPATFCGQSSCQGPGKAPQPRRGVTRVCVLRLLAGPERVTAPDLMQGLRCALCGWSGAGLQAV